MNVPSFDELNADQLKELIQTSKNPAKKSKKIPLEEEKPIKKSQSERAKLEVMF